jgi:hypothetical protein
MSNTPLVKHYAQSKARYESVSSVLRMLAHRWPFEAALEKMGHVALATRNEGYTNG